MFETSFLTLIYCLTLSCSKILKFDFIERKVDSLMDTILLALQFKDIILREILSLSKV